MKKKYKIILLVAVVIYIIIIILYCVSRQQHNKDVNENIEISDDDKYEWLEDDIGINVVRIEWIKYPEEEIPINYQQNDDWQLGDVADLKSEFENNSIFCFITLKINNDNSENRDLWDDNTNMHRLCLFGVNKGNSIIDDYYDVIFCTNNKGNNGEALHEFGNVELSPGENIVVYGFHLNMNDDEKNTSDWYLGDTRRGLTMDINKDIQVPLIKINTEKKENNE